MTYNPNDSSQNIQWNEVLAGQLENMSKELYGQASEAHNLGFSGIESSLMTAYQAVLNAASALREEGSLLEARASAEAAAAEETVE